MKRALLAATAMIASSFSPVLTTPAFAAKPPINDTTGLTPQEVCDAQLTPNEHSDFETYPINQVPGSWVTVNTNYGDPVGEPYGVGIPTAFGIVFDGTYIRHGGSPNVWGGGTADSLVYPQTGQMYETTLDQERTTTFDCYVYKIVGHDTLVDPAGLQSTGNSAVETQTINGDDQEVVTEDDFIADGGTPVTVLICISPNNTTKGKPGTWKLMHGFTGSCTDASNAAGTDFIPSGNNPTTDDGVVY